MHHKKQLSLKIHIPGNNSTSDMGNMYINNYAKNADKAQWPSPPSTSV
jgi:hypothetical protein